MVRASVVQLLLFIAAISVSAVFVGAFVTEAGLYAQSIDDESGREVATIDAEIAVINDAESNATYDASTETVTLYVKNVGGGTLDLNDTEVVFDGSYVEATSARVIDDDDRWRTGHVAEFTFDRALRGGEYRSQVVVDGARDFFTFDTEGTTIVETHEATNVTDSSATLNGELLHIPDTYDTVDVHFEWRETGESAWNETAAQTRTEPGTFSENLTGLREGTEYEYRAVAVTDDYTDTGDAVTFVTNGTWAMYSYDTANAGHYAETFGPTAGAEPRWEFQTGGAVSGSAAVKDRVAYFGSEGGTVYAVDTETGDQQWATDLGAGVESGTAVADGVVYVPTGTGVMYALDASDGSELWSYDTGNDIVASPTVENGSVYIGTYGNELYQFDAATGDVNWVVTHFGDDVRTTPAVVDDRVYVGSHDDYLYSLYAENGTVDWSAYTADSIRSSPTVVDGSIYVGTNGDYLGDTAAIYAFNATDGSEEWRYETETNNWVWTSPAYWNGTVYVATSYGQLLALDETDGSEQWRHETGEYYVYSSPAVVDETVYVGQADNSVYALNATDGSQRWSYETGNEVDGSPAVVGGVVYVGSDDGVLYALAEPDS